MPGDDLLASATGPQLQGEIDMNLGGLGPGELLLILVIVLVIFGAGRLADIGGSLGKGIREFRNAVREEDEEPEKPVTTTTEGTPQS